MKFELFGKIWDTDKTYYYAGYVIDTSWYPCHYLFSPGDPRSENYLHILTGESCFNFQPKWIKVKIARIDFDYTKENNPVCDFTLSAVSKNSKYHHLDNRNHVNLTARKGIVANRPTKDKETIAKMIDDIKNRFGMRF